MVRVKDLPVMTDAAKRPVLLCRECFGTASADPGDYFYWHPTDTIDCCGEPMMLAGKIDAYVPLAEVDNAWDAIVALWGDR